MALSISRIVGHVAATGGRTESTPVLSRKPATEKNPGLPGRQSCKFELADRPATITHAGIVAVARDHGMGNGTVSDGTLGYSEKPLSVPAGPAAATLADALIRLDETALIIPVAPEPTATEPTVTEPRPELAAALTATEPTVTEPTVTEPTVNGRKRK